MKTTLTLDIEYDPDVTDPEGLATAMDRLMETARSIPKILDEYGNPKVGEFFVATRLGPSQFHIDPELLRRQLALLAQITDNAHHKAPYVPGPEDEDLLEGLLSLTEAVSDSTSV